MFHGRFQCDMLPFFLWLTVSNDCLAPNKQFFSYINARTSYIRWDYYNGRFVLDQHAKLDLYSASALKQLSAGRRVAPLGDIILISS
jgi:hypothetical protein